MDGDADYERRSGEAIRALISSVLLGAPEYGPISNIANTRSDSGCRLFFNTEFNSKKSFIGRIWIGEINPSDKVAKTKNGVFRVAFRRGIYAGEALYQRAMPPTFG